MTSISTARERLARRIAHLYATDPQFAAARPDPEVARAMAEPGLRLPGLVRTALAGYADRPALGERATEHVTDPATGRTTRALLPAYTTVSYGQVHERVRTLAAALAGDPLKPGDRACVVGFASVEYAVLDLTLLRLGVVAIPLQSSAPPELLRPIVAEAGPSLLAASVDSLDTAVELALSAHRPRRLVVFDHDPAVDEHRETYDRARARLAGSSVCLETLAQALDRGRTRPPAPEHVPEEDNPLTVLIYTSGSTGAPKGAMYPERLVANFWRHSTNALAANRGAQVADPSIVLVFMPMSHLMGRAIMYSALGSGGTAYFAASSDQSTLLEDLALVRPTNLELVPRIWEMLFQHCQSRLHRTGDEAAVLAEIRERLLGGRYLSALTGSAPISPELRAWAEELTGLHVVEGYGATEVGLVLRDGVVASPPVREYKLADVPELGYFSTDHPHPRGELLVKTDTLFAGYYQRPETTAAVFDADGFYRTGDIFAQTGPDRLVYLDRRNFVLKLSQGEFVAVSKLEAVFAESTLVRQIYVYGNSARSYLLAVVVPTEDALAEHGPAGLKRALGQSLRAVAQAAGLQSYEIPRDLLVETTPFSRANGLLTDLGKLARPNLAGRYGPALEQHYQDLAQAEVDELRALRAEGADGPVLDTVRRAAAALLGAAEAELGPDAHFTDLGGDSLSALTFANLLRDIFAVQVPVGVIISPATDLAALAAHVEALRTHGAKRPTAAAVHGEGATSVRAADLTLDKFLDQATITAARTLPGPRPEVRTVLLTGATGFLGRYLALEWLARLAPVGGRLVCLVRAKDDQAARARLDRTFDTGDPELLAHYRALAADHLEVLAADKGEPNLGLDGHTWQRLAEDVDLVVDPAALVNHVLSYEQLFGPNVVGTAELIRLALTTRRKPYTYVSTVGVGQGMAAADFVEDNDIRQASATRALGSDYANGYASSKWAGEVLLREAHEHCGLPVAVFRCDMIMADTRYTGQLNLPDLFTRMMLSLLATGIAPASFYQPAPDGTRPHHDGLPVDFIAEAITTLGVQAGFRTYHVSNPHDDGISLDTYVDWLVEAGHRIERIPDHATWLARFEAAMRALPEPRRSHSLLPLLHNHQEPEVPRNTGMAPAERFRAAVREARIPPDKDIPHITPSVIVKYADNLRQLGLL
ncbi:fatty acid CoA ligase FadD9 [Crossiella equi]|uniref:Carboxylic acid reductase n=2 Tax=Crossiella equi TaxID=130796 RepID=A0ABS5AT52_9PSEU|nr:carboxylic acid reductase [Crossiella equi]MBP2479417.1 fatty acid CoA ligase FadD9 [Crossiella equi]